MTTDIQSPPLSSNRFAGDPLPSYRPEPGTGSQIQLWGDEGFSFWDLLDIVNPLQHLPVVSTLYRDLTGDQIGAGPRLLGGGLFGGPSGIATSAVNVAFEADTGKDIGGHMMALLTGEETLEFDGDTDGGPVMVASMGDRGIDPAWDQWPETTDTSLASAQPSAKLTVEMGSGELDFEAILPKILQN